MGDQSGIRRLIFLPQVVLFRFHDSSFGSIRANCYGIYEYIWLKGNMIGIMKELKAPREQSPYSGNPMRSNADIRIDRRSAEGPRRRMTLNTILGI